MIDTQNSTTLRQYPWLLPSWQAWQQLQGRLGHAYLLPIPQGMGVEVLISAMVQQTLCKTPTEEGACGHCASCQLFQSGQHPDYVHLKRLEDKKEVGVDQVRQLIEQQSETSHQGGYKVIWVEAVEELNISAFNALLKTLEEPGDRTLFILSCGQLSRLPATIKSRCQKLPVQLPDLAMGIQWLAQQKPQLDNALLKRALRLNWGAPLAALNWIDTGLMNEYSQWQEGLQQASEGRKTASKVSAVWLKWSQPENVFDYFYHWALMQLRQQMYSAQENRLSQHEPMSLLRFQQQALQAKQFWKGNANKELVMENLLIAWLQLSTDTSQEALFKPLLNRGML